MVYHVIAKDIIELRHTPLVRVPLVGKAKFILHIFTYPLGELCRQILECRMVVTICVLKPFVIRSVYASESDDAAETLNGFRSSRSKHLTLRQ